MSFKRVLVTRAQVLKAIRTEPLARGYFIQDDDFLGDGKLPFDTCPVCAVGGLLRSSGVCKTPTQVRETSSLIAGPTWEFPEATRAAIKAALTRGDWLSALSLRFENGKPTGTPVTEADRSALYHWARRHLPCAFYIRVAS